MAAMITTLLMPVFALLILIGLAIVKTALRVISVVVAYFCGWLFTFIPYVPEMLTELIPIEVGQFPVLFAVLVFVGSFFRDGTDFNVGKKFDEISNRDA